MTTETERRYEKVCAEKDRQINRLLSEIADLRQEIKRMR